MDVEHPLPLVDAVNGALIHTGAILDIHARFGDHIGHRALLVAKLQPGAKFIQPPLV
jgi:hypothetical protein